GSEAVHLMFAARQRSPEGLGDLPQDITGFKACAVSVGAGKPANRPALAAKDLNRLLVQP
ncbi:hypothetical protein ACF8EF_20205, partial [Pseudomonas sp. zjy_15]|uniref:hypothetical protein n=1 Tax=unclassified Pseudomonas TaxID=196821 RepID=UPI00370B25B3